MREEECCVCVCFPLDAQKGSGGGMGSTARNVSGARTHKKNDGRQNPRASYFTVCQAVTGFYNITDKHLAKKNCAHQNGFAPPPPLLRLRYRRDIILYDAVRYTFAVAADTRGTVLEPCSNGTLHRTRRRRRR